MTITKGEFTRFSLNGRMQLLQLYGTIVFQQPEANNFFIIYKINNFYALANLIITKQHYTVRSAEPVTDSIVFAYITNIQ